MTLRRLEQSKTDGTFKSYRAFAQSEGLGPTTLHNWIVDSEKWNRAVSDNSIVINRRFKLGSGRRSKFAHLEVK